MKTVNLCGLLYLVRYVNGGDVSVISGGLNVIHSLSIKFRFGAGVVGFDVVRMASWAIMSVIFSHNYSIMHITLCWDVQRGNRLSKNSDNGQKSFKNRLGVAMPLSLKKEISIELPDKINGRLKNIISQSVNKQFSSTTDFNVITPYGTFHITGCKNSYAFGQKIANLMLMEIKKPKYNSLEKTRKDYNI